MLSDAFIHIIKKNLDKGQLDFTDVDPLQSILRWGYYLNYAILPMAIIFNNRLFRNIASYFCLPFSILSAIFFKTF